MFYVEKNWKTIWWLFGKKIGFPVNASGHNLSILLIPKTVTTKNTTKMCFVLPSFKNRWCHVQMVVVWSHTNHTGGVLAPLGWVFPVGGLTLDSHPISFKAGSHTRERRERCWPHSYSEPWSTGMAGPSPYHTDPSAAKQPPATESKASPTFLWTAALPWEELEWVVPTVKVLWM